MPRTVRRGSEGITVGELQQRLRELGFDAPGEFGPATEAAVVAFQERRGLMPDAIVGPMTWAALDEGMPPRAPRPREGLVFDTSLRLDPEGFFQDAHPKDLIVLHHTVGASAASSFRHWQTDGKRIATAYLIERDGVIHEIFDPRQWAFHLGLADTGGRVDQRSIGIEIASEGGLTEKNGDLFKFGRTDSGHRFARSKAFDHGSKYRGFRFYARYTHEQLEAVTVLVDHLCSTFGIERRTPADHLSFDRELWDYRGIVGHHHVRPDKTDVHPGFDWDRLRDECGLSLD